MKTIEINKTFEDAIVDIAEKENILNIKELAFVLKCNNGTFNVLIYNSRKEIFYHFATTKKGRNFLVADIISNYPQGTSKANHFKLSYSKDEKMLPPFDQKLFKIHSNHHWYEAFKTAVLSAKE